jgi:hypothetical protein
VFNSEQPKRGRTLTVAIVDSDLKPKLKMVGGNAFDAPRPPATVGSFFDQVVVRTPKRAPLRAAIAGDKSRTA